jgi:hypothetical protein
MADLAHQAERMERIARRMTWLRSGTVARALAAGAVGELRLRWCCGTSSD